MAYNPYSQPVLSGRRYPCPGERYNIFIIPTDPDRTVDFVEFDYNCKVYLKAAAWLRADGGFTDIRYLTECPCTWKLNRKVRSLKLITNARLRPECMHTGIVYEQEEWTSVAPGASYPLPPDPPEISRITFEAKTDAGNVSEVSALLEGEIYISASLNYTVTSINWPVTPPESSDQMAIANTGSSTVYIRDLTTE